jgi:hypothetical protein
MSLNGVGLTESIVHARTSGYPYRAGMGMINSAEFVVMMDDFVSPVTTNLPLGWDAVVIDTGATVYRHDRGSLGPRRMLFDSDGAAKVLFLRREVPATHRRQAFLHGDAFPDRSRR